MAPTDLTNIQAIKLTRFFMRFTGFWISGNPRGKLFMDLMTGYTIIAIIIAWYLVTTDLWYSRSDFHQATYTACNMMTVLTIVIKLTTFSLRRKEFMKLIQYCYDNFWKTDYDEEDVGILHNCEIRCVFFVETFTFFALTTVCTYAAYPIIANIGRNETDRIHPFTIWLDFPATTTPYFETIFVVEIFACFHSGVCYFCFDNFLCIVNVFTAGQFRILQRKLRLVRYAYGFESQSNSFTDLSSCNGYNEFSKTTPVEKRYKSRETLKDCIEKHQALIAFTESVENMYTLVILGQVVIFSLLICLVSYQAVLADGEFSRRMIFIVHSAGTFTQLFMFTLTCDDLIRESQAVAEAAYSARWYYCLSDPSRRTLGKDLMFVIMRARRPCCLTAGGFCPISLETFTTILSSAMSYLTLLRNGQNTD
ncbi:odorant receptor 13a-like [Venturia canescens]|uniref:odorant receptor 13a-like n=1 Tax=Venturia canescens TaxID=32260 RepID=UPI001C9D5AEE|nr:odorant receptor 13a-like [Venturia canescens]